MWLVALTGRGDEARAALVQGPPEVLSLPPRELETLIEVLGHLPMELREFANEG